MDERDINAVVGGLYLALVQERAKTVQLSELLRQTAEAQAGVKDENNISQFPAPEPTA